MRNIGLLIMVSVVLSCGKTNITNEEIISKIQNSNYKIFYGVTTEARNEMDGVFKTPFLKKEIDGQSYLLPNFEYYECEEPVQECLPKGFDIEKFYELNITKTSQEPHKFVRDYTTPIFKEFEKIRVYRILSRSSIGECIIFYIDENNYVAYVPDIEKIHNELWKLRFVPDNKIGEHWYAGKR